MAREWCLDAGEPLAGLCEQVRASIRCGISLPWPSGTYMFCAGAGALTNAVCCCGSVRVNSQLAEVQSRLLDVGSAVATPMDTTKSAFKINRTRFSADHVDKVEVSSRDKNAG